jgi:predicted RNA-binding protein
LCTHLEESIPNWQDKIDKVTLSGLYGPVPYECEKERSVLEYDFRLTTNNKNQIEECTNRLVQFLERHGKHYEQCIAYGTSNAYRTVFDKTAKQYAVLKVFPINVKSRRLTEFFRKTNIDELLLFLLDEIGIIRSDDKEMIS